MTSSAKPSKALKPEAIAISIIDDGDDDGMWLDWGHAVAVTMFAIGTLFKVVLDVAISDSAVTVDVITTVVVSVLLRDKEPDVRLLMTSPGSMLKGVSASQATVVGRIEVARAKHILMLGLYRKHNCPRVALDYSTHIRLKIRETQRSSLGPNPELY